MSTATIDVKSKLGDGFRIAATKPLSAVEPRKLNACRRGLWVKCLWKANRTRQQRLADPSRPLHPPRGDDKRITNGPAQPDSPGTGFGFR
jgi:hypothetical protein